MKNTRRHLQPEKAFYKRVYMDIISLGAPDVENPPRTAKKARSGLEESRAYNKTTILVSLMPSIHGNLKSRYDMRTTAIRLIR